MHGKQALAKAVKKARPGRPNHARPAACFFPCHGNGGCRFGAAAGLAVTLDMLQTTEGAGGAEPGTPKAGARREGGSLNIPSRLK